MALTAILGTATSDPSNVQYGIGAAVVPHQIYSGIYAITPGVFADILFTSISYPLFSTTDVPIPTPFIETAYFTDQNSKSLK